MENEPYNLDFIDTYSNVLYVKGKVAELALLAKTVYEVDRFRPESCNVIGK
jgi:anaphase-promoting complex subunit 8